MSEPDPSGDTNDEPSGEPPTNAFPRLSVRGVDLLLIILLLFGSLLSMNTLLAGWAPLSNLGIVGMLALQTGMILGVIYLVAVWWRGAGWAELGLRSAPRKWYSRAAVIAFLVMPLVGLVNFLVMELLGAPIRNPQIPVLAATAASWPAAVGMLLVGGIAAPFAEELAFRGLLYGWLRQRLGVTFAALASGLAFSLLHGIPTLIPAFALLGVVLALVYEKSRSLWPPVVMHATFNIVMMLSLYVALATGVAVDGP